jgi:hypothetical protein
MRNEVATIDNIANTRITTDLRFAMKSKFEQWICVNQNYRISKNSYSYGIDEPSFVFVPLKQAPFLHSILLILGTFLEHHVDGQPDSADEHSLECPYRILHHTE